ncbi:hypothetical protein M1O57_05180 [Dehalococcoidia bacterium]|nr:hypothetical protein [Dehalococcoidia bacterium]MCL0089814.1 hypothetical protein [Dehalococcoidia bacterium]MCL0103956.1 hypothetical protein [Dehalococcoidia bacterium]MCL0104962.1 hypothetical protein [Dehalococcoidia bacterium]
MIKKKQLGVLPAIVLAVTMVGTTACLQPAGGEQPSPQVVTMARVVAVVPDWSGFVDYADEWNFGGVLVTTSTEALEAKFIGA